MRARLAADWAQFTGLEKTAVVALAPFAVALGFVFGIALIVGIFVLFPGPGA